MQLSRFSDNLLVKYTYSDYDSCDSWTWPSPLNLFIPTCNNI